MKHILISLALLATSSAFAQTVGEQQKQGTGVVAGSSAVSGSTSQGGQGGSVSGVAATNGSASSGNAQNITFTAPGETSQTIKATSDGRQEIVYSGTQTVKNVPSVNGPSLITSNDTCMGSTSGSVNIAGVGVGGGTSWVDGNCKMLKNSRELWNMGMKAAALALMCTDSANREALELTGFECPQTTKARKGNEALQAAVRPSQEQYTDPIVRARLGLAPLPEAK